MYNLSITTGKIADGFSALLMLCCILMVQSCTVPVQTTASLSSDNGDGTYTNPVINADYPDPDIIRVGEDFYMVSSSFVAMPGIPICHSKDLINWRIIGHAYDSITFRPQYRMENEQTAYSRLCWAPSIKYHDGTYYIGVNIADDGFVMFKSNKPEGPYSMHKFDKRLYDPGFFIDDDGKKYVTHGKTKIYLTRLKDDGTGVLDPNDEGTLIIQTLVKLMHRIRPFRFITLKHYKTIIGNINSYIIGTVMIFNGRSPTQTTIRGLLILHPILRTESDAVVGMPYDTPIYKVFRMTDRNTRHSDE